MIKKRSVTLVALLVGLLLCMAGVSISQSKYVNAAEVTQETQYALLLDEYVIKDYTEGVTVTNPKLAPVKVEDGKFLLTDVGTYKIQYANKIIQVIVYEYIPTSTFTYSFDLSKEFKAADIVVFPQASINSAIGKVSSYTVILEKDGAVIDTSNGVTEEFSKQLFLPGNYTIYYCYQDVFGYMSNDSIDFNVKSEKNLIVPEIPGEWYFNTLLNLSQAYGYFNGEKYAATVKITSPDGIISELNQTSFLPSQIGNYTFLFSSDVNGETLTKNVTSTVKYEHTGYFTPVKDIASVVSAKMPSYVTSKNEMGVEIRANSTGASVYYNQIIDLNNFTKDDNLISFFPMSHGGSKLTDIKISLVDVYDSKNVVTAYWWGSTESPQHGYMLASNGSGFYGRNNEGASADHKLREKYGAITHFNSFSSSMYTGCIPFNMQYDIATNQLYSKLAYAHEIIYDLDDDTTGLAPNNWAGFTTGEVYLRIEFSGVAVRNSGIAITEVAKTHMNDPINVWSGNSDFILYDFGNENINNMPVGVVGKAYRLPLPIGTDIILGTYPVGTKLISDPLGQNTDVSSAITSGQFIPSKSGKYRLVNTAFSAFGAEVYKNIDFTVTDNLIPITIAKAENGDMAIDSFYALPSITATGGSGTLIINRIVTYNDVVVQPDSSNKIFLDAPGIINIAVKVSDFLGAEKSENYTIAITQDDPLIRINGVPTAIFAGERIVFPDFVAYDLLKEPGEQGYEMAKTILVDGVKLGSDRSYTAPKQSKTLTVTYVAGEGNRAVRREYSVVVISEPISPEDYMIYNRTSVSATTGKNSTDFLMSTNETIKFPNKLKADGLELKLGTTALSSEFSSIVVNLEDFYNEKISLKIEITNLAGETDFSALKINEIHAGKISGKIGKNSLFAFSYDNAKLVIKNEQGSIIANIATSVNGDLFSGFTSGTVRLTVGLTGVIGDSTLQIISVMGQTFNSYFESDGDLTMPAIVLEREEDYSAVALGSDVTVSAAIAVDMFQPTSTIQVSVRAPSGYLVITNANIENSLTFKTTEYGFYTIIYTAYDALMNKAEKRINISVVDNIAPVLSQISNIPTELKVGDSLKISLVTATDNVTQTPIVTCFIQNPSFGREIVSAGSSYVFKAAGKYQFVVIALDDAQNIVRAIFDIVVR